MDEFNTQDFETFLALDDLKGSFSKDLETFRANKPEVVEEPDLEEEFADDGIEGFEGIDDNHPVFEDEDGFESNDESDEDEDEVDDETEQEDEETDEVDESEEGSEEEVDEDAEYEEGEAYDVDFDTVITLPDGRELTIEELSSGYVAGTELNTKQQEIQEHMTSFEERVAGLKDVLMLAELEADKVIKDYDGFDWEEVAAKDPQAYVENSRFLERYKARKAELVAAQQRIQTEEKTKADETYQAKCVECVQVLKKEIPNWDEPLYQNLLQYAIDLGSSEEEILKENRPSVFLALYKAYQFDKGKERVLAKIKRPGAPRKVMKPGSKNKTGDNKTAAAAKAFSNGRLSHEDAFKYLVD